MDKIENNNKKITDIDEEIKKYDINDSMGYYRIMRLRAERRVRTVLNKIYSSQNLDDTDDEVLGKFIDAITEYEKATTSFKPGDGKQIYFTLSGGVKEWYSLEEIESLKDKFYKGHAK